MPQSPSTYYFGSACVRLDDTAEVAYWTRELGATEAAVRVAVMQAGTDELSVRGYLARQA